MNGQAHRSLIFLLYTKILICGANDAMGGASRDAVISQASSTEYFLLMQTAHRQTNQMDVSRNDLNRHLHKSCLAIYKYDIYNNYIHTY